jgi:hypothetical protein
MTDKELFEKHRDHSQFDLEGEQPDVHYLSLAAFQNAIKERDASRTCENCEHNPECSPIKYISYHTAKPLTYCSAHEKLS